MKKAKALKVKQLIALLEMVADNDDQLVSLIDPDIDAMSVEVVKVKRGKRLVIRTREK